MVECINTKNCVCYRERDYFHLEKKEEKNGDPALLEPLNEDWMGVVIHAVQH